MNIPPSIPEIIDLWPRQEDLAADCGVERVAVSRWKSRYSIPAKHFAAMLSAAKRRGINLSAESLAMATVGAPETNCSEVAE